MRSAPARTARSRRKASKCSRSTMPMKPLSIGMSTCRAVGETIRALVIRATICSSGIAKSRIRRGGIAPPQGLMRPARSRSATLRPARARSAAAVAPAGAAATQPRHRRSSRHSPGKLRGASGRAGRASMIRTAKSAAATKQHGLDRGRPCQRHRRRDRGSARRASARPAPSRPPKPAAIACAPPHRPMRVPSRRARPSPASCIIGGDGGDGKGAVGEAEQADRQAQRQQRAAAARAGR